MTRWVKTVRFRRGRESFKIQTGEDIDAASGMSSSKKTLKTLWPLFMDGVQLPQGYSHFEEAVYFLPFSSQKFLVLNLSTSEG